MDAKEFEDWFLKNVDTMVAQGVMHPKSPWGRTVKLALSVTQPEIQELRARIEALEKKVKKRNE